MKAMYAAFFVTALIAVGAYYGLSSLGFSSQDQMASDAVRLGDASE
ncbi:hypothetical protein HAT86_13615 [Roseovarius gahaiensis]|uniref:Uncharacterized protein n=1 Tax=Roseovarius gahaiensis TaxID=2716691 RepID=A0A967BHV8_9RHOB|nr:hypothetical protein [Roseovarius gahaiensis]NHQ75493.1 hypothetical protein [Roseovarius gahaiensis]